MAITLKQMRYVLAVAHTGHFGQAAHECAVSQPALSQQIQALETACGSALFDRLRSGVRLTPFGRDFVELARTTVSAADALDDFALHRSGSPDRPIRFGLIPTVAPYLLPEIFPRLTRQLPELRYTISENRTEDLLSALADGSLDVALIASDPPAGGPRLAVTPLFEDPFVLATPRNETTAEPVSLAALAPERILLLDEGHCFRDQTISACRLEGDRAPRTFAATSLSTIVEFVANGQGVTLLPRIALRKEASDPRISIHRLDDPGAGRLLTLVWREANPLSPVLAEIAKVIRGGNTIPDEQM
ncbi:LysR family transcriptional regulator, hydrogen peroxide-inducible genes activator [Devosia crocina]|uniref:LysR family transcriptional regulator, hydrogen peroxide-inducible genes activator n=1 Tax=Devosia crocina TaxID=429728 RepID=A0A1I7N6S1_9HYPH|nr:hydrogen peroxide-inducible genes activator [Devosia crocina]SFV30354.1 LysR family transcriptional regulator, hydrogen peroxide-inducible genes activator [Devosia crocina]